MVGPDAIDFAHRLFSRNIKNLASGQALLSLFLSAEAKVGARFWVAKEENALRLFVSESEAKNLESLIERYHFGEKFKLASLGPASMKWRSGKATTYKDGTGELRDQKLMASWRNTDFEIEARSQNE